MRAAQSAKPQSAKLQDRGRLVYANGWSASANRSRLSRCAIPSTISMVATLTVHTRCSRSMTFSLWSEKR